MTLSRVVAIVGPTASGKSALAEEVAIRLQSGIVSIDSMQVYREMNIGTAKLPLERRRAPLEMVDVCDVGESYSVERFQRDARHCVNALIEGGKVPVLCGGTGLYLNAVITDMSFPKGSDEDARRHGLEELAERIGPYALHDKLAELDPKSAACVHPNNVRRVIRAIELAQDGLSYADQLNKLHTQTPVYDARIWAIDTPRDQLYQRINARVDEMFDEGLTEEVAHLKKLGLADSHTARQAIGYKEILDAFDGMLTLEEARETIKTRTRRYAKRQLSWFKHDDRVRWLDGSLTLDERVTRILTDLKD